MPQTPPFHALQPGRKLSDVELATAIRLNLEAELDAINLYAAHIEATDNEEAKAIIRHVMDEEKEHAGLFHQLLKRLDPAYAKHAEEAPAKYKLIVAGAPNEAIEAVGEGGEAPEITEPVLPKALTIGSLFKR
jgi:rubrerythrin